ncbi:MAG: hypothetical protein AAB515_01505 [Patescibacteria group bacterium]
MPNHLQDILTDLYAVEPTLQQREAELVPIIQKLLAAKPDAQVDPAFREKLRLQLLQKTSQPSTVTFFTMRKFSYALFAVFVVAIAGVGTYAVLKRSPAAPADSTLAHVSITQRAAAAFGALGTGTSTAETAKLQTGSTTPTSAPAADRSAATSLIAPDISTLYTVYEYVYTGGPLTMPDAPVLKHVTGGLVEELQSSILGAKLGLLDLGSFTNLELQSFTMSQTIENGYAFTVDAVNGTASIYTSWPQYGDITQLQEAGQAASTASQTLPLDSELIAAANAFVADHDIARSAYGAPVVNKTFLPYNATSLPLRLGYQPTLEVVYPLLINDRPVVNDNGAPSGLSVFVDAASKKVTGVNNLTTLTYEASTYPLATDTTAILDVLRRGGVYGNADVPGAKKVRIEVGAPSLGYLSSRYQVDQTAAEYLVPAYIFPITNAPTGEPLYRTAVVVPLVQQVLDQQVKARPAVDAALPSGAGGSEPTPDDAQR